MTSFLVRPRIKLPLAAVALLAASSGGRAEAQFGIGIVYPGIPFLSYTPERAPSPTAYLYDRSNAYISAYGNEVQRQIEASRMSSARDNPNAYFNQLRDYSGENAYQVASRQSLGQRTSVARKPPPPPPATGPAPSRPGPLPLDAYFLPGGALDWPHDVPDTDELRPAREEVDSAVKSVRDELRSRGKAKAQTLGIAKAKLVGYGQRALSEVRSARSRAVADVFHNFLLLLHQSLDQAAEAVGP